MCTLDPNKAAERNTVKTTPKCLHWIHNRYYKNRLYMFHFLKTISWFPHGPIRGQQARTTGCGTTERSTSRCHFFVDVHSLPFFPLINECAFSTGKVGTSCFSRRQKHSHCRRGGALDLTSRPATSWCVGLAGCASAWPISPPRF